ncbi:MAG TPA: hypothetical protein PK264_00030 [Hyphomicrobiaceae bacterium]|nr:hypothetical protein [Hyphomicrobiaceae bacterium]
MRVPLAILFSILAASAATAQCPTRESAAKGFILKRDDGVVTEVVGGHGGIVQSIERFEKPMRPQIGYSHYRGLIALVSESSSTRRQVLFDQDLSAIFPLKSGTTHNLSHSMASKSLVNGTDEPTKTAKMRLTIGDTTSEVEIGGCRYVTIPINKFIRYSDGMTLRLEEQWSADIEFVLARHIVTTLAGKEPTMFALTYVSISVRP